MPLDVLGRTRATMGGIASLLPGVWHESVGVLVPGPRGLGKLARPSVTGIGLCNYGP